MTTTIHVYTSPNNLSSFLNTIDMSKNTSVLIQIFMHSEDRNEMDKINHVFHEKFENPEIIGCVSNHNISNTNLITKKTVIAITTFTRSYVSTFSYSLNNDSPYHLGTKIGKKIFGSVFNILYTDLPSSTCQDIMKGITEFSNKSYIGGGTIPPCKHCGIYHNGKFLTNTMVGFSVNGNNVFIQSYTNKNYISLGKDHIITESDGHEIISIDNMPAKEFYEKYLGKTNKKNIKKFSASFPLLKKEDKHKYPLFIQEITNHNTIVTDTPIQKGDLISIGYGKLESLIGKHRQPIKNLLNNPIDGMWIFTGKITNLQATYPISLQEIPLFGLLTDTQFITNHDEIVITKGNFNIMTLSEKVNEPELKIHSEDIIAKDEHTALLNLVERTSHELNILNQTLESMVVEKTNELFNHYYSDSLTNLPNLNKLTEKININEVTSIALIDISSFVNINNFYGNHIGNKILIQLSKLIISFCKNKNWMAYRVHSDIFAVTANDCENMQFNKELQNLQKVIHHHVFMEDSLSIYITTVIGISHNTKHLYENASMTLEYAKGKKIPFLIYHEDLKIEESIENNLIWTSKIRKAIEQNRIVPFYQPIYNNASKTIDHYEVLMRLVDEDGTVYTPYHFLKISKKANLYKTLTKTIIDKAFDNFSKLNYHFSINISSEDMLDEQICNFIYNRLSTYPKANQVIFEIVESEGIENYEQVKRFIEKVKSYGASIAIDDFGTGFSNFHYLFKLNVDLIKIDGSIIEQINSEKAASLVAETIVDFAKKMGISTVAEFVSSEDIFNKTNDMGINYSQGYYVSIPKQDII